MAAPYCHGNDLYYNYRNGGVQRFEDVTRQFGNFNGSDVSGSVYSQPAKVQRQMYYYKPYATTNVHHNNGGSGPWAHMGPFPGPWAHMGPFPGPNPYYMNMGDGAQTQMIQGDVVQRGTFNGRGIGARIHGHFCVSGDIN